MSSYRSCLVDITCGGLRCRTRRFKIEGFPVLGFMKRGRFIKYEGDRTAKMIANVLFKKAAGGKFLKPCVRDPLEVSACVRCSLLLLSCVPVSQPGVGDGAG
jgi:hypothetical protein